MQPLTVPYAAEGNSNYADLLQGCRQLLLLELRPFGKRNRPERGLLPSNATRSI